MRASTLPGSSEPRLWSRPDVRFLDEAQKGERFVAWARLAANLGLVGLFTLYRAIGDFADAFPTRALAAALVGASFSAGILVAAYRRDAARWLPFFSSLVDLTSISASFLWLAQVDPLRASNLALVYLLIIAATCLRYDARLTIVTGAAAILQYEIVVWAALHPEALGIDVRVASSDAWMQGLLLRPFLLGLGTMLVANVVVRTQRLRQQANHDRLTGLLNRGYFDDRFAAEVARAERSGERFTLVMLDVDHFKRFNDEFGHAAGDRALRAVASVLARGFRASDLLARYGGEEFVGVLFRTRADAILGRLDATRERIARTPVALPRDGAASQVTASFGVAVYPDDGLTAAALLEVADRRLYAAKLGGRNLVVASDEPPRPAEAPAA
ncbi:MAG TPA: GGDEF domain-containing protein [Myxococcota bacterium]|jgi:diguanylate cyclase (GGDEF)-like protein|nr:GGDEF domain-containing protein [Myxococcota bacterium]